jgi:hypothetical protein
VVASEAVVDTECIYWKRSDCIDLQQFRRIDEYYNKAYVFGSALRGRGLAYRETTEPQGVRVYGQEDPSGTLMQFIPNNPLNSIQNTWHHKNQYSSWCRLRDGTDTFYGQINIFFRINMPKDSMLDGTPIASLCCCSSNYSDDAFQKKWDFGNINLRRAGGAVNHKLNPYIIFCPITNLYSTSILLVGFDADGRPINVHSKNITPQNSGVYSTQSNDKCANLYLLELNPERRNVTYEKETFLRGDYNNKSFDID